MFRSDSEFIACLLFAGAADEIMHMARSTTSPIAVVKKVLVGQCLVAVEKAIILLNCGLEEMTS